VIYQVLNGFHNITPHVPAFLSVSEPIYCFLICIFVECSIGRKKVSSLLICIMNQHDALFVHSLLNKHASTCFGTVCGASSGGSKGVCGLLAGLDGKGRSVANGFCFDSKWSVGRPGWKGTECGKWYLF
jgi:hypothetical protein